MDYRGSSYSTTSSASASQRQSPERPAFISADYYDEHSQSSLEIVPHPLSPPSQSSQSYHVSRPQVPRRNSSYNQYPQNLNSETPFSQASRSLSPQNAVYNPRPTPLVSGSLYGWNATSSDPQEITPHVYPQSLPATVPSSHYDAAPAYPTYDYPTSYSSDSYAAPNVTPPPSSSGSSGSPGESERTFLPQPSWPHTHYRAPQESVHPQDLYPLNNQPDFQSHDVAPFAASSSESWRQRPQQPAYPPSSTVVSVPAAFDYTQGPSFSEPHSLPHSHHSVVIPRRRSVSSASGPLQLLSSPIRSPSEEADCGPEEPFRRPEEGPSDPQPPSGPGPAGQPTQKPKRRRADAAQLRVLNEVYARTAFPSTEERAELARRLGMSPRQVQIWFQNRRQNAKAGRGPSVGGSTQDQLYSPESSPVHPYRPSLKTESIEPEDYFHYGPPGPSSRSYKREYD